MGHHGSGSSHTPVRQSITVKLKSLTVTTMTRRHFTRSQYLHPDSFPVPKSSFFHLGVERKAAPGDTDTMLVLGLGSEALIFSLKEMDQLGHLKQRRVQL